MKNKELINENFPYNLSRFKLISLCTKHQSLKYNSSNLKNKKIKTVNIMDFVGNIKEDSIIGSREYNILKNNNSFDTLFSGDETMKNINTMLDMCKTEFGEPLNRGYFQRMVHKEILRSTVPIIYRNEWNKNSREIMKRYKMDSMVKIMGIKASRRSGKTISVAIAAAALLLCIPGIEIAVFAHGLETSVKLTDKIRSFMNDMSVYWSKKNPIQFTVKNRKELKIYHTNYDLYGVLKAYPNTINVKGAGKFKKKFI